MSIRTSAFRGLAILSLTAFGMAACEDKDVINIPEPLPPAVEVTVAPTTVSILVGGTASAAAVVKNSTNQAVTWSSANAAVATVSAAGVITGVTPGSTIITATSAADANAKGLISVTVTAGSVVLSVLPSSATLTKGATLQMAATVSGSTNQNVTWATSAASVATVSATGLVTAVNPGTAVITATSVADPNVRASGVITVSSGPSVVITLVPAQASTVVGGTVQLQASVPATFRSSDTLIARVNASGLVTGVSQGTAVITAIATADTTAKATAVITVQGASVAIAVVPGGVQTGPGPFIIQTNVAIPAGAADSLMMRLTNVNDTTLKYTWRCQTFTAAGAATQVHCPINPADFDPYTAGVQILPNGTYTLQAVLIKANIVADVATWGTPITTNYSNTVSGVVTWDNTLVDNDNVADDPTATSAAAEVWYGGSATVTLSPALFTGGTLASTTVRVDIGCDGATTADVTRTVTFGANGTGSVTFSEANSTTATPTPGIDNVENANVCFVVGTTGIDAGGAAVPLVSGLGNVTIDSVGNVTLIGTGQTRFRVDNVEPAAAATALVFDVADFDGHDGTVGFEVFLGANSVVSVTGSNPTVLNASAADLGVGGLTYIYYAVPAASYDATSQTTLRASAAAGTAFTSPAALAETLNDTDYVLVVEVRDALGNRRFAGGPRFGVDLTAPTLAVYAAGTTLADGAINPTGLILQLAVTDIASGAEEIRGTVIGRSIFEIDGNIDEDVRCYEFNGTLQATNPTDPCSTRNSSTPVLTLADLTTEIYQVTLPADENFYTLTITARDAARNVSTTTITRTALVDVTAGPDAVAGLTPVTINSYTIDNLANTATVNAVVRDNIDLASYDARFVFPGLVAAGGTDVPDQVPFTQPVSVGAYGLPLLGQQTVSASTAVNVDGIATAAVGAAIVPTQFGIGVTDVAGNFAFGGVAIPAGTHNGDGFSALTHNLSATLIDRTPASGVASSTTVSVVATVGVGAANPFAGGQLYLYYVTPGGSNVLYAVIPAATVTIATGETARTYTWTTTVAATSLPVYPNGQLVPMYAIAVAGDGDGFITDVDVLTLNQ